MKKIMTFITAALALAACEKNRPVSLPGTELTATLETGVTKSHIDGNKVLWDANDEICVFSLTDGAYANDKFITADGGASAVFKGGGITLDENVYALFPYDASASFDLTTGIGFQADYTEQKVVNGSFGPKINLAAGKYSGQKNIGFKNAGAFLSFKLTQERADTIRRIEIKSNDGTPLAFNGTAAIQWNEGAPVLTPAPGAEQSDVIKITPSAETFATGDTYYVWVLPGEYNGITVTLISPTQMTAVKAGESTLAIARNQVVNLGEIGGLTFKAKEAEKKALHFDFSGEPQEGWPAADKWKTGSADNPVPGDTLVVYCHSDGNDYKFFLTDVGNAMQARVCWDKAKGGLVWYAGWRYVGLPALERFKLVRVSGVMCLGTNSKRKAGVVENVAPTNVDISIEDAHVFVSGGESTGWTTKDETYTFNLEGTKANTRYYLLCTATSIGVSSLDLVYEKVE